MKTAFEIFILFLVVTNARTVKQPVNYQEVDSKSLLVPTEKTLRGIDDVSKDMSNLSTFPSIQTNASKVIDPINHIIGIINEAKKLSVPAFNQLELHYQIDSNVSLQEVDIVLRSIEDRKLQAIGVKCAIDEILSVTNVVKALYTDIKNCGITAVKEPLQIVKDVEDATFQIVFDGYELLESYRKCDAKSMWGKIKCYVEHGSKLASYSQESYRSIRTLKGAIERISAITSNTVTCSRLAKNNAVTELKVILNNVNVCLVNKSEVSETETFHLLNAI